MAIFGQGNNAVSPGQIQQFLANPNLSSQQILDKALETGVSLNQIRQAAPNDTRFSDSNALPFLASQGITPSVNQAPPTGLIGSEQAIQGANTSALQALTQGTNTARADIQQGFGAVGGATDQGIAALAPFADTGNQAFQLQGALSGALGNNAQAQAIANFKSSPGQEFLQNRGEQAVLRNNAATGGLQGGRVLQELQQQGIGFAQNDFANQFNRLGQLSGFGLQAAGQQANLRGNQAGITGALSGQLGQIGLQGGQDAARLQFNTGQSLATGRTRAGEQLANLASQQGAGTADILATNAGNLANLLAGAGQAQGLSQQQLSALLASIGLQSSGQVAGLGRTPGTQFNPGILGGIGAAAGGIGTAAAAISDILLKQNINLIGVSQGGHNIYTWSWNDIGKRIASAGQKCIGVIAQEVINVCPEAVTVGGDGYLRVNYSRLT